MPEEFTAVVTTLPLLCWVVRVLYVCVRGAKVHQPAGAPPVHTMAVLGSGGHTAEMLTLLASLGSEKYAPRDYVLAKSDHTSAQRIEKFEASRGSIAAGGPPEHQLLRVPRSREVGQSYVTSVLTTLYAFAHSVVVVLRMRPSLLLCNGPGTCIPICAAALGLRLLGIKYVTIVYVESICRVHTLSLSGKILLRFADHFLVQWPQLTHRYPKAQYIGRLS